MSTIVIAMRLRAVRSPSPQPDPRPSARDRLAPWRALTLATLAHGLGSFAALAVAPLSPFLVEALHLTRAQVGLFLPAVYLGGVVMSLPAGWLTDHLGVRLTLGLGLAIIGVMVALTSLAGALPSFLALLVVAGFGFSVLNPATGRAIVDWFPPRRRGAAMGIKQTGLTLGGVAAALVLPRIAHTRDLGAALVTAALVALGCAAVVAAAYRAPAVIGVSRPATRPKLSELGIYLGRPGVIVVLVSGFFLSVTQSSLLGYLALYSKETFGVTAVVAGQLLALAQVGGAGARLGWGFISDRFFGGRRRPGIVMTALGGAVAFALFALGARLPWPAAAALAVVAGAGAFGWVGLYFALVAEIGGTRHAGTLTGVAVIFAWSGVLVGPPLFGLALEATGSYALPWLGLAAVALTVAMTLPWPKPLVHREPYGSSSDT